MRFSTRFGAAQAIAARNHGLLTTADLRRCGFNARHARQLRQDGVVARIIQGLYRVHGTESPVQDIAAAVSRHQGAVASHRSAAFLHDLVEDPGPTTTITLPPAATGRTSLGVAHRSPLDRRDVTRRQRIPTTTVARTIVDLGEAVTDADLAQALNLAIADRQVTLGQITDALCRVEQEPGRIGHARLRRVLAPWTDEIRPESPAEAVVFRRIHDVGLPRPETQYTVTDRSGAFVGRVDLAWPDHRVLREYDSARFHGPERTEADEERRQAMEALGWTVGSITRVDLRPGEDAWLRTLRTDLAPARRLAS